MYATICPHEQERLVLQQFVPEGSITYCCNHLTRLSGLLIFGLICATHIERKGVKKMPKTSYFQLILLLAAEIFVCQMEACNVQLSEPFRIQLWSHIGAKSGGFARDILQISCWRPF